MRKISLILVFLFVFALSSCGLITNEFDKAFNNMEKIDSFRMDITMENVPLFGTVAGYILVDSAGQYSSFFGEEDYTIVIDNLEYELVEFMGETYAIEKAMDEEEDSTIGSSVFDEFNSDNFSKNDEGYYVSEVNYDDLSNVKVKIDNDYFSEIKAKIDSDGYVIDVTMEFSGFNSTTINYPEYLMMDGFTSKLYQLDEEGLTYTETTTGFELSDWLDKIVYENGNDYLTIEEWFDSIKFYPNTLEIVDGNVTYTLDEYYSTESNPAFEREILILIAELYSEMN